MLRTAFKIIPLFAFTAMLFTACDDGHQTAAPDTDNADTTKASGAKGLTPQGPKPAWGPSITPGMQTVIEALDTLSPTPIYTVTPQQARLAPTPADAVTRIMHNHGIPVPASKADTAGKEIPVAGGNIHVRIYTPNTGKDTYPVIVYYHGGGWVIATIDTYHASAQALAEQAEAIVVSVEYRKGPEHKFPTAHNDAFAAYKWVLTNAWAFKGDTAKVAVVGESAGGNMAIGVSMMARDARIKMPVHQVAVYPVASDDSTSQSRIQYKDAKPLSTPALPWFLSHYLSKPSQAADPRIALVKANLKNLPPTTIIGAEIDPLQTEGKILAEKFEAAGVKTTYKLYNGVTHEFFGMATVIPEAKDAQELAVKELKKAW